MPIAVLCPGCDSRLNAPDAAAGKTVKCPKCKTPMVVPVPDAEAANEPPPPKKSAPASKKRAPVKAKAEPDDGDDDRPRKKTRPTDEDDRPRARRRDADDDGDEDDDRPRKKKKSRKAKDDAGGAAMVRTIIGVVLLVVAVGVAAFVWWNRSRNQDEARGGGSSTEETSTPGSRTGESGSRAGTGVDANLQFAGGAVTPVFTSANPAARSQSMRNLKQIALGMHNFHDVSGALPAGIFSANGKVGLSWRVALLPYLEQQALYQQFKLDEPWDGPTNKKLIAQMPSTYTVPGGGQPGFTYYRTFTGPDTPFPPRSGGQPGKPALGLKFFDISDGSSTTALVVEAGSPVEWTRPDELEYATGEPIPRVGGLFGNGFGVALGDGSVMVIRDNSPQKVKALATAKGGEMIELP